MSFREKLIFAVIAVAICVPLYIHMDVAPFLPFEISPKVANWLSPITFAVTAMAVLFILFVVVVVAFLSLIGLGFSSLFPRKTVIACHPCDARITPEDYAELQHCPICNSNKVYCEKCGRASVFDAFSSGDGCEHCGHPYIALRK